MRDSERNFWPAINIGAFLSGLLALGAAGIFVMAVTGESPVKLNRFQGDDQWLFFLVLALAFVITGAGCVGTFKKKWWGGVILGLQAATWLFMFPVGTVIGIFVLIGLKTHKEEFRDR